MDVELEKRLKRLERRLKAFGRVVETWSAPTKPGVAHELAHEHRFEPIGAPFEKRSAGGKKTDRDYLYQTVICPGCRERDVVIVADRRPRAGEGS